MWQLITLGISGGVVPCPAALAVLLAATSFGAFLRGVSLVVIFSCGMAMALVAIGITMVHAAKFAGKYVAENRTCGVDALQWVTGCTAGKGNLVFKDYGKQAYTLYSADTKKGVRVVFNGQKVPEEIKKDKTAFIKWLLTTDAKAFLTMQPVEVNEPDAAKTKESAPCSLCGEAVSMSHLRESGGKKMCIPCMEKQTSAAR